MDPKDGKTPGLDAILRMASGFQASRVLLTGHELGVFDFLAQGVKTSGQVAFELGTDARAMDRLLNALTALGLLKKMDGKFSNTEACAKHLVRGEPGYLGGMGHLSHLFDTWSTLTEAVRAGRPAPAKPMGQRGEAWITAFIEAMHWRAGALSPVVARLLNIPPKARILDLGGGSGAYSFAFVRKEPTALATLFDLPMTLVETKKYVAREGLSDRVFTQGGDYLKDPLSQGFDLVFCSAILHIQNSDENRMLVEKCARSLKPQGLLVVQDFIMDEDRTTPVFGALFALNMLVGTEHGDTYTQTEVEGWMRASGLSPQGRVETGLGTTLILGKKS